MNNYKRLELLRDRILFCKRCKKAVEETKNFPFKTSLEWILDSVTILFLSS